MELSHPSVQKSLAYLNKGFADNVWPLNARLPSILELSKCTHVSTRAMQVAIGELARQGKLSVSRKRGIFIGESLNYSTRPTSFLKWQSVKIRLEQDIFSNKYPTKLLPSINELKKTYGCGYASMRRLLTSLVEENIVIPYKKTYRIETLAARHSFASVLLISARFDDSESLYSINDRFREAMQAFEKECAQASINVRQIGYTNDSLGDDIVRQLEITTNAETIIGYIIWTNSLPREKISTILRTILPLRRPVALFDEKGTFKLPYDSAASPFVRVFTIANVLAGAQTAQYLIAYGHKSVGFITSKPAELWSQKRLQGMRETFANAGYPDGVIEYATKEDSTGFEGESTSLKAVDRAIRQFPFFKEYWSITSGASQLMELYNDAADLIEKIKCYRQISSLLKTIVANESITALVGVNDATILATIDILKQKKSKKKNMAFVGFDDTDAAFTFNFSSYNFNVPNAVGLMLQFIRNPDHHFFASATGPIECKGLVVERSSSQLRV